MKIHFTLLLMLFTCIKANSQSIPNAGFENWTTTGGYNNPDGWATFNTMTSPASVYTCLKGTPGSPGASYIKLVSKPVTGMGVVPGMAVSGTINNTTMQPENGFSFSLRPMSLTGSWQHMLAGSSPGYIDVQLTYWDAGMQMRMPVATAHQTLGNMAMSWSSFSFPLTYVSGNAPDSCLIILSASGSTPTNGDYLYVDNLNFTGTVTGINNILKESDIAIFPNPAKDQIQIKLNNNIQITAIKIIDVQGRVIKTDPSTGESLQSLNIAALPKGGYILEIKTNQGLICKSFSKQ